MFLLFVVFLSLSAGLHQGPPLPPKCSGDPISSERISQLLGPGGIGPVSISNISSAFGMATQQCNAVSGCTPWSTYTSSNGDAWPYVFSGSYQYEGQCNSIATPLPMLAVANGTTPIVYTSDGEGCNSPNFQNLGDYPVFIPHLTAALYDGEDCSSSCAVLITGAAPTTSASAISLSGAITDDCFYFTSQIYTFT